MLVLWYGGKLVNEHELNVGILTGKTCLLVSTNFINIYSNLPLLIFPQKVIQT